MILQKVMVKVMVKFKVKVKDMVSFMVMVFSTHIRAPENLVKVDKQGLQYELFSQRSRSI